MIAIILIVFIVLFISMVMLLSNIPFPPNIAYVIVISAMLLSATLSVLAYYCCLPKNPLKKSICSLSFWLLICTGLLLFSCYRLYLYFTQGINIASVIDALYWL